MEARRILRDFILKGGFDLNTLIEKDRIINWKFYLFSWEQRKLNEVTDVRDGTHDSPKYIEFGHPFIT